MKNKELYFLAVGFIILMIGAFLEIMKYDYTSIFFGLGTIMTIGSIVVILYKVVKGYRKLT